MPLNWLTPFPSWSFSNTADPFFLSNTSFKSFTLFIFFLSASTITKPLKSRWSSALLKGLTSVMTTPLSVLSFSLSALVKSFTVRPRASKVFVELVLLPLSSLDELSTTGSVLVSDSLALRVTFLSISLPSLKIVNVTTVPALFVAT